MQATLQAVHIEHFWKQFAPGLDADVAQTEETLSLSLQASPQSPVSYCLVATTDYP